MSYSIPSRDYILLEGMAFYAYHGANPEEKEMGQRFLVDIQAELDLTAPGHSDNLADAVSYTGLYHAVKAVVEGERFNLLEAVAEAVAQRILASFPPVSAVLVRVAKVSPPIKGAILGKVAVEVYRHRGG